MRTVARMPALLGVLLLVLLPGQHFALASSAVVELSGARFQVEVAEDFESRARGLMHRASLPDDAGMLFVFEDCRPVKFWMRNVLISLDILFFDERGVLIDIHRDIPPCRTPDCPLYPSSAPIRYALELNAGTAVRIGARPGQTLAVER